MTNKQIEAQIKRALELFRIYAPRRPNIKLKHPERRTTDNLKRNAIKLEMIDGGFKIFVDENIAPYMPYTNEKWISPKWKGAQNPNEQWWNEEIQNLIYWLAYALGGTLQIKEGGDEE